MMELNERIKSCRQRCGMTQEQVAEAMNVSRQAVTKWENGQSAPSTEKLFKLAELFGTTVDLLLNRTEDQTLEEKEHFAFLYSRNFWISAISGLAIFFAICPYGYDMYIPAVFTFACAALSGYTCLIFSVLLHKQLSGTAVGDDFGMYVGALIFGMIGHGIFAFMNWGSWICLVLSAACIVWLLAKKWSENQKNSEKST